MRFYVVLMLLAAVAVTGCTSMSPAKQNLPPASALMHPGPGVDGPGPGVMLYQPQLPSPQRASQVLFVGPEAMQVRWQIGAPGMFDSEPLICPGRYNFPQGAIYRLEMTNIPGRPGVELYPTLEVGPSMPRTEAFLAHNAIPVQFAEEDFDQVLSGNFVTKVIYLPDPQFQELALAGVETLVSTRLDPGVDPIVEADRRGAILAVVRLGNKDFNIPSDMIQEEGIQEDGVMPAAYQQQVEGMVPPGAGPQPLGTPVGRATTMPTDYVSGVNAPQYGMPMCGTPIGLPGPPHVPLGIPAGLQRHTMRNLTHVNLPEPTRRMSIDVLQKPGFSYPKPVSHAYIQEETGAGPGIYHQPMSSRRQVMVPGGCGSCEY